MRSFSLAILLATVSFVPVQAQEAEVSAEARDGSVREPRARQSQDRPVVLARRGDGNGSGNWQGRQQSQGQAAPQRQAPSQASPPPSPPSARSGNWGGRGGGGWQGQSNGTVQATPRQPQTRSESGRMARGVMGNDGNNNWQRRGDNSPPATQAAPQPRSTPQSGGGRNWNNRSPNGGNGSGWTERNRPDGQARSGGWQRGDNGNAGVTPPVARSNPGRTWDRNTDGRSDRRWDQNRDGRIDRDRGSNRNGWSGNDRRRWDRNWRNQNDYDWRGHRNQYRQLYRAPSYYSPYGYSYGYRRFGIGLYLESLFYSDRYWINDPWEYRLPEAYGPYRWVRYYNDVLLIDLRSGEVVDVIHDFFW